MKQIFLFFIAWRFLLLIPLIAGYFFISYNTNAPYTNLWNFIKPYPPVDSFLLFPWANFDGVHYLSIAANGYAQDGSNARFFPLFPMVTRGLSQLFGGKEAFGVVQFFSGLLLANSFFLLALIVFYKLVRLDYSHSIAVTSMLFLLVFPTSFFFASIYSESLFLLLLLLSFYFARKKRWFTAGVFGMLLCATRIVGIAIFPALIFLFVHQEKVKLKTLLIRGLPLLLIPMGLLSYALFNLIRWGNALTFLFAQGQVINERSVTSIVLPVQTIIRYVKILATIPILQFAWWTALLEVLTFLLVVTLLTATFKKKVNHSYLVFALFALLIPTFSGTFTALPRYVLVLFPIFMTLALLENKIVEVIYAVASVVILFILLVFFSRGYFIA